MDKWLKQGSSYSGVNGDFVTIGTLPLGVYNVVRNERTGVFQLEYFSDKFVFPDKVYGMQQEFVNYVLKTIKESTGNIGILLNGIRGTGKTWTAKVIANTMQLPIIIVKPFGEYNQQMVEFLCSINSPCVFLLDEFEKHFMEDDSSVLTLMDGLYVSEHRRIFLLTTNKKKINENLLSRPSRIRYVKEFGNLELEVVREYLNDTLNDKEHLEDIVNFVDELEISTIDILRMLVTEINIHGYEEVVKNKGIFNVTFGSNNFTGTRGTIYADTWKTLQEKLGHSDIIKEFLREEAIRYDSFNSALIDGMTDEEKMKFREKWDDDHYRWFGMSYHTVESPCRFNKLKPGMEFDDYFTIVKIDFKNKVVVAVDEDDDRIAVYKFTSTSQSSLYHPAAYAYSTINL